MTNLYINRSQQNCKSGRRKLEGPKTLERLKDEVGVDVMHKLNAAKKYLKWGKRVVYEVYAARL
jgi:hypothetical protein